MVKLRINNQQVEVAQGSTIMDAATRIGLSIPSMCMSGEVDHFTSCMICIVKDVKSGNFLPSCTAKVSEDMEIITEDSEIIDARKTAIELLLSDHTGDCEAPCRIACPAFMNIPLMNRLIASGNNEEALKIVRKDIALPGVLGRICSAPCEKACKRVFVDEAVSICLLKRFSYDYAKNINIKTAKKNSGKKVAIIGSGPAGLSAAFYLQLNGIQSVIYDKNNQPGGELRYSVDDKILDKKVLDAEIEIIRNTGVEIIQNSIISKSEFKNLQKDYDSVIIATGKISDEVNDWGINNKATGITVNKENYKTNIENVFAIGNVIKFSKQAIRSVAQGKEVADIINNLFEGKDKFVKNRRFNSSTGKVKNEEISEYLKESISEKRQFPKVSGDGFSQEQAIKEASRCLHCDCRKPDTCKLREYADNYNAKRRRFAYTDRKPVKKIVEHKTIIYEQGKCIKCGICVRITAKYKEEFGLSFIGRGFDVEISVPFNEKMDKALKNVAEIVAQECPTGALSKFQHY